MSEALPGRNRISSQAMASLTQAATAEQFGVSATDVRVSFTDDGGALAIAVATPIALAPLGQSRGLIGHADQAVANNQAAANNTVWHRTIAAKAAILNRVAQLCGVVVARVDIRLTSVKFPTQAAARADLTESKHEDLAETPRRRVV